MNNFTFKEYRAKRDAIPSAPVIGGPADGMRFKTDKPRRLILKPGTKTLARRRTLKDFDVYNLHTLRQPRTAESLAVFVHEETTVEQAAELARSRLLFVHKTAAE